MIPVEVCSQIVARRLLETLFVSSQVAAQYPEENALSAGRESRVSVGAAEAATFDVPWLSQYLSSFRSPGSNQQSAL